MFVIRSSLVIRDVVMIDIAWRKQVTRRVRIAFSSITVETTIAVMNIAMS